jgi:hypothetical protein
MQIWRAIVRTLSGSATTTGSDPLELADAQLHQPPPIGRPTAMLTCKPSHNFSEDQ